MRHLGFTAKYDRVTLWAGGNHERPLGFTAKRDSVLLLSEGEIMRGQAPETIALIGNA